MMYKVIFALDRKGCQQFFFFFFSPPCEGFQSDGQVNFSCLFPFNQQ